MKYHQDNGHGWLEVPIAKLKELNIEREISTYSYMDSVKGMAYLEEDDDMQFFLEHCPELKILKLESVQSDRSFIRDLESYKRFQLTGLEALLLTVKKLNEFGFSTDISLIGGCIIYASDEALDTAITITIKECSILMKVNRISNPDLSLSNFTQKIENPARKDLKHLVFKCCSYYQP